MSGQINKPKVHVYTETFYSVFLRGAECGGQPLYLGETEAAAYEANPDLFAAKHFGFATVETYREWASLEGLPRCSEHTAQGKQCNAIGGPRTRSEAEWVARHRNAPCKRHGGER
jgi:hypothetical protein